MKTFKQYLMESVNFKIHALDNEAKSITASINGIRYEYFLPDFNHEDYFKKLQRQAHFSPGKALNSLKQKAKNYKKLDV